MWEIVEPRDDAEIAACFPVMAELRPHLRSETFVARVRLQESEGYRLACLVDGAVVCVAGYRVLENLSAGRVLYVDDLVTRADARSHGYGDRLFDWLVARSKERGCDHFELDSGVQRYDAHRFYFRKRMFVSSYRFRLR